MSKKTIQVTDKEASELVNILLLVIRYEKNWLTTSGAEIRQELFVRVEKLIADGILDKFLDAAENKIDSGTGPILHSH